MTSLPVYIQRIARLPEVLAILSQHPTGLPLDQVAEELGVDPDLIREEIRLFYMLEIPDDPAPPETIEFIAQDGGPAEPHDAPMIRLAGGAPMQELGVQYLSGSQLATLYRAALALLELDPDDTALEGAVEVLERSLLPGIEESPSEEESRQAALAAKLGDAIEERRCVRIHYTRAWEPGTIVRDVAPYFMVRTRRGWELDAASVDDGSGGHSSDDAAAGDPEVRTYLLSGITALQELDTTFERRVDVVTRITEDRVEVPVTVLLPVAQLWVAQRFAEHVEVVSADAVSDASQGEAEALVRVHLLPPVEERLGLMLLIAGSEATVDEPVDFDTARADVARALLEHHRQVPGPFLPAQSPGSGTKVPSLPGLSAVV